MIHCLTDHVAVQMATLAGVDLNGGRTGRTNTVGIIAGLLVALDHCGMGFAIEQFYGFHQQRGLA